MLRVLETILPLTTCSCTSHLAKSCRIPLRDIQIISMPFKIIIVGCGVAGLAAAIALAKKGHKVTILEATSKLQPIGGSIVMQANANRVLDDLGIYEELLKICAWIPFGPSTRRYKDGEFLIKKSVELHQKDFGFP